MVKDAKDGSEGGLYTDEHRKRTLERMKIEGFSLEIQVYEKMLDNGWNATLNRTYWNIDPTLLSKDRAAKYDIDLRRLGKEVREMDIAAEKTCPLRFGEFRGATLVLALECKTREGENWVVYTDEYDSDDTVRHVSFNEHSLITYLDEVHLEMHSLYDGIRDPLWGTSHQTAAKSQRLGLAGRSLFKSDISFNSAVRQVIDAADFLAVRWQWSTERRLSGQGALPIIVPYWRVYPVIVFDGPLWEFTREKDEPRLRPLESIEYLTEQNDRGYSVDIVRWDCLGKYLKVINQELEDLSRLSS